MDFTELHTGVDNKASAEGQPLPEALRSTSIVVGVLCFLALGCPNLDDDWKSLQSEQSFDTEVKTRMCSILSSATTMASLLAISGVFVGAASPMTHFGYTSSVPYGLLFISLIFAIFAMLTSGSSMIHWLHADRHSTREQLKQGGYFVWSYLLSVVTPMFFVVWSLNCFVFAMLTAGFSSQSEICRAVTALGLAAYVVNVGKVLMEAMHRYRTSLEQAGYR